MSRSRVLSALELPPGARVEKRVPKKLLIERTARSSTDRRLITAGLQELTWEAVLKPSSVGLPEYRDDMCRYEEIAVLGATLSPEARADRLEILIHRAIPYPLLLVAEAEAWTRISAARKGMPEDGGPELVVHGDVVAVNWTESEDADRWPQFLDALSLERTQAGHLRDLYNRWVEALFALQAARITGTFSPPTNALKASERQVALAEYTRLQAECTRLRSAAMKEKQLSRQVELNLELKRAEEEQNSARGQL